ncbi:S9 family peptidase [Roseateles toxinivorans]|uniref:Dipeptidyl aminopeptidase/acylaminoacyl peptidase n=1 Tax=Roseateles toxinivorans TaxID=270368 RepID=A0A4R6QLU3_9BURK|nr:prolyl oligopeptidase family serine peptidase [Roseateles toxinivorans]TDP63785.1 dipeptidyl aminopeptidase/acylaminoacyl peptidase [Roseateles toxinivorans]
MTKPLRSLLGQPLLAGLLSLLLPLATQAQEAGMLKPNANLVAQGIPDIPAQLVEQVGRYTDFRGHSFVDWHPQKREMLISHRKAGANTVQLYLLRSPMAEPEQLTDSADTVRQGSFEPISGKYVVFERSSGGNEANQLYRLDLATKEVTLLTDPAERHDLQAWLHKSSRLLTTSVPLDKTAQGGSRASVDTIIRLMDPLEPKAVRTLATLPGGGWGVGAASRDDKQVALTRYLSANESEVWLLDLASGKTRQVLPAPAAGAIKASHFAGGFTTDNKGLYVVSDRAGEFRELMRYDLAKGSLQRLTRHIPWDVDNASLSHDGRLVAAQLNVDGRNELRLFDGKTLKELPAPALPEGSVSSALFHPRAKELALATNGSKGPSQIYTLSTAGGKLEQWTQAYAPPGVDMSSFPPQQIVRWKSFDGQTISGLLSTPPARFTGKRPVMVLIHGGPEGQATVGFLNRYNYYVNELGIALLQPNVRGSSGYGKTFLSLDDGYKREDSVKDIGALFDWIATQPNLDASRVLVTGGSYGGYMSLAVSTHYADRIAGAIDVVGISNFVSFLQNTESYRRDLRRVEYGDERDPTMRAFLQKISPLNNAGKITKPLFVVQGKNDPRVPFTEAEQIVAKARENKTPVWYLRAENEGHGFARKENADFQFYATILFLQQTLLK